MEYQVQINSIKAKLQETRARKKQQEELIMKVENQALKVSSGEKISACLLHSHWETRSACTRMYKWEHADKRGGRCLHVA